jgi:carotenoid 1,2-hydratase
MNHCALNVALYGSTSRWAMTERSAAVCARDAATFVIGPSRLLSHGERLHVAIDEVANPLPRRVRGEVTIALGDCSTAVFALTPDGTHRWGPINPRARITVALECPRQRWEGWAYLDSNEGDEAIDQGFSDWDWSRAHLPDGSTAVLYEVRTRPGRLEDRDSLYRATSKSHLPGGERTRPNPGNGQLLALQCFAGKEARRIEPGTRQSLGHSKWRIAMHSYQEGPEAARIRRSLEDTPFYARSLLDCRILGHRVEAVHETLDARRFALWWVQNLLPWRMPRAD